MDALTAEATLHSPYWKDRYEIRPGRPTMLARSLVDNEQARVSEACRLANTFKAWCQKGSTHHRELR